MNIFQKIAMHGLFKNRVRTLVTIIGVALSTALITGITTFAISLQSYMINGAIVKYGGWHAAFANVNDSFLQAQADNGRVKEVVSYENIGYAKLEGGKNPDKPYLFLAGFNKDTFEKLPLELISGRFPQNSSEIVIPSHVATNGEVNIPEGSTITLAVGKRRAHQKTLSQHKPFRKGKEKLEHTKEKSYTVVGVCQRPVFEEYSASGYTAVTISDANKEKKSYSAFVTLKDPYYLNAYVDSVGKHRGCVFNDNVLRFMGLSGDQTFNALLYSVGGVLAVLIMIGSIFLIYNSFHISLNERTHDLGILMSVGATERQIRYSVLFEGLCIGMVGIPLGILIGIPSIDLVIHLVSKNFVNVMYDNVPLVLQVSAPAIAAAVVFSLITILISAYLPSRKAARTPIMECIRQTNEIKIEAKEVKSSKFIEYLCGLEGMLAIKNFKRNRRRYRSIILSLTLSIVLFVSASAFRIDLEEIAKQSIVAVQEENRNILFVINVFTAVFIGMISLIAIANVFNTISTNIKLRRRELAMLRSIGMPDRDFNRMMRFECVLYGLRTLLFGIPIAGICSWLIYKGMNEEFKFIFPWGSLGISILGVFIIIFITMLYAVSEIKKENIIEALRDE